MPTCPLLPGSYLLLSEHDVFDAQPTLVEAIDNAEIVPAPNEWMSFSA